MLVGEIRVDIIESGGSHIKRDFFYIEINNNGDDSPLRIDRAFYYTYITGTYLLIGIIDATWNVNACYYEVSYASARSIRMRRSTSSALGR